MASNVVDYIEYPYALDEIHVVGKYSHLVDTLRILEEEIRSRKVDNDKIMQAQEKQEEVNVILL